ncbi:MAG: hypothetical protein IJV64_08650 [Oscillospiraceae bacterium]|nr:hypothetical protein [Oscillospiraceae bacterium]
MKKVLISLLSLGALLLTAGCAKELVGPDASGDTVQATFTVAVPDGVATKAVSDGTSAGKLEFAVYDASGNYLSDLSTSATIASGAAKHWTVTVRLVKGLTYDFAFFAHSSADGGYYTFSGENKTVTADYTKLKANDDKADSFYAVLNDVTIADANLSQNVTLTRPVAQVNVACPNEDHTAAGYSFKMATRTTQMVLTNISNTFNLFDGTVSGATTDATLDYAAPNDDNITVSTVDYKRQAMAYVLVGAGQTTDVTFRAKAEGKEDDTEKTIERSITNVPLKTNYRTNILGNIYTSAVQFDIVVDEDFNVVDEYADDNFPTYASIADLNTAFAAGKGIGYTVAVAPAAPVTEDQTITLPDTDDEVSIFFRGNFSAADITIRYSSVAGAKKPSKLTIEAPRVGGATKSINKLIGNLPATTVVLTGTTVVDEAEFHTASSTLQITKDAKILNKLTVYAGSLVVEGFIETAVIDPAVAVNTVDAVATVKEDGEVVRFVVQNLNAVIEEGAKVGTLEVKSVAVTGETITPHSVTIEGEVNSVEITTDASVGAPEVIVDSDAEVNSITGDTSNVKDENGEDLCIVTNLTELQAAITSQKTTIYFNGEPITEAFTITPSVATAINGLKVNHTPANVTSSTVTLTVNGNVTLNEANITSKAYCIISISENKTVTLKDCVVDGSAASAENSRAININGNSSVTIDNSTVKGPADAGYSRCLNILDNGAKVDVINGTTLSVSHYAINMPSSTTNAVVNVKNSSVNTGWAVSNIWGTDNTIDFDGCNLNSLNDKQYNSDGWNNFSAFVFNANDSINNNKVTIKDCKVSVQSTTGNKQSLVSLRDSNDAISFIGNNTITLSDTILNPAVDPANLGNVNTNTLTFNASSLSQIENYLDADCVVTGPDNDLYTVKYVTQVYYYWYTESVQEGTYCSLAAPFVNEWLADGEYISLQKSLTLNANIVCQLTSGKFTMTFGDFTITKGDYSISLPTGVSVVTDKETDIFTASEEGAKITKTEEDNKYTYSAVVAE